MQKDTDADWAMVRLTRQLVALTAITGFTAIAGLVFTAYQVRFSVNSAAESGRQTAEALRISNRLATATEAELQLKRVTDIDIGDVPLGLTEKGWSTNFVFKLIGAVPIKSAKVFGVAGHVSPDALGAIWDAMDGPQSFDIAPNSDHTFRMHAMRFSGDVDELRTGKSVMITAIKVLFVDGNGKQQERRGCIYYISGNIPQSCDKN